MLGSFKSRQSQNFLTVNIWKHSSWISLIILNVKMDARIQDTLNAIWAAVTALNRRVEAIEANLQLANQQQKVGQNVSEL